MDLLNIRIFILKVFLLSIPFNGIPILVPQLRLPTFIFFLYLLLTIPTFNLQVNQKILKPILLLILIYGMILIVSFYYYIPGFDEGFSFLRQFPVYILIYFSLSSELANGRISMNEVMQSFIAGSILSVILFILNIGVEDEFGRLILFGRNPNITAVHMAITIMLIFHSIINLNLDKRLKYIYLAMLPISLYLLILTGSRGGIFALIVSVLVYYLFKRGSLMIKLVYLVLGLVLSAIITLIALSNEMLSSRFFGSEEVAESRLPIWEMALNVVRDNVIFGVGIFKYNYEITKESGRIIATHNEFLSIFIYSGLIGFIMFIWFLYLVLNSALKTNKIFHNPIYVCLLSIIILTLFKGGGFLLSFYPWVIFSIITSQSGVSNGKKLKIGV